MSWLSISEALNILKIFMVLADLQTYKTDVALGPHLRCAPEDSGYPMDEYDPRMI
jgi:hypothetical protein